MIDDVFLVPSCFLVTYSSKFLNSISCFSFSLLVLHLIKFIQKEAKTGVYISNINKSVIRSENKIDV